jgi:hypothetical protein
LNTADLCGFQDAYLNHDVDVGLFVSHGIAFLHQRGDMLGDMCNPYVQYSMAPCQAK